MQLVALSKTRISRSKRGFLTSMFGADVQYCDSLQSLDHFLATNSMACSLVDSLKSIWPDLFAIIRRRSRKLIVLDYIGSEPTHADLGIYPLYECLDQTVKSVHSDLSSIIIKSGQPGSNFFVRQPSRCLIAQGGLDPLNKITKQVASVLELSQRVDYSWFDEIHVFPPRFGDNSFTSYFNTHKDLAVRDWSEFRSTLQKSRVAFIGGGITLIEAIAMGVVPVCTPTISHELITIKKVERFFGFPCVLNDLSVSSFDRYMKCWTSARAKERFNEFRRAVQAFDKQFIEEVKC